MEKFNLCFTTRNNRLLSAQTQPKEVKANKSLSFQTILPKNRLFNTNIITYMNLEALMTSTPCASCRSGK